MAEDAGYIYASIVFDTTQLEQGLIKSQAAIDATEKKIKKHNDNITSLTQKNINGFFKGWEKGFVSSGQRLGKLLSSMFNPLTLGIGALTIAIGKATSAISGAIKQQLAYNKALKDGKNIAASATKEVTNYGDKVKTAGDRQKVFTSVVQDAQEAQRNYNVAMQEASRIDDGAKRKEAELNAEKQLNTEVFTNLNRLKEAREVGEKDLATMQNKLEATQKYLGVLSLINPNIKTGITLLESQVKSIENQNTEYDKQIETWNELDSDKQKSIKNSEREAKLQKQLNRLAEINKKAADDLADAQSERNKDLITEEDLEKRKVSIIENQRNAMRDITHEAGILPEVLTRALKEVKELDKSLVDIKKTTEDLISKSQKWAKEYGDVAQGVSDVFTAMIARDTAAMNSALEDQLLVVEEALEAQQEMLDLQYEITMSKLEEERQAALEAAGFVAATTEENLTAALEAAMASGDEGVIYREKRRQEELKINQKYDNLEDKSEKDKAKADKELQEQAAHEKAELEYKIALNNWEQQIIQAHADLAMAVIRAIGSSAPPVNFILAGLSAAAGAIQIQTLQQNKPKQGAFAAGGVIGLPQTYNYENGGIVDSPTPRGVDAVQATLANREMILNDSQQANLFNAISSGSVGGATYITVNTVFDGEIIASRTVELINNGMTATIDNRMVT
jgi:hypothetical protein